MVDFYRPSHKILIIIILLTALIEHLPVLLEYNDLSKLSGRAYGKAWALPGVPLTMPLFETKYLAFPMFQPF